ncbi:MAG: SecY-interacting protein Syd [Gemmataceae bacterium]
MDEVARELLALLERATPVPVEHDPEWPSVCEQLPADEAGFVRWRPVPMEPPAAFEGIALYSSLRAFYGSFWSGAVAGRHSEEVVGLSLAWNEADLVRITETLRSQIAAGEPVFVAHTNSDWFFGVDNNTGTVYLCEPGRPPVREVAPSLAAFLAGVS